MKIKVVKGNLASYWYSDRIGKVYDVEEVKLYNKFQYKVIGSELVGTKYFDKDDVEIINEEKVMKKSDLRTGMRVVHGKHPRQEGYAIVVCDLDKILFKDGGWNYLSEGTYNQDLTACNVWDITEVYDVPGRDILNFDVAGELLWKREAKTAEQYQLDVLQGKIAELTKEAEKLQGLIGK